MTSLDVDSLFTNIPLGEAFDTCINKLFPKKSMKNKLRRKYEVRGLSELVIKECFFLFGGKYYLQIDRVAMGSPFRPTLAKQKNDQLKVQLLQIIFDDIFILVI